MSLHDPFLKLETVEGELRSSGGVQSLMADGSVRPADTQQTDWIDLISVSMPQPQFDEEGSVRLIGTSDAFVASDFYLI